MSAAVDIHSDPSASKRTCRAILVVEDDLPIQQAIKGLLELEGYETYVASNGQEALKILPSIPSPCLILLDILMPIMDGLQFLELKQKDIMIASIPVVLVSAQMDRAKDVPGVQGRLKKPIDLDALLKTIQIYCG